MAYFVFSSFFYFFLFFARIALYIPLRSFSFFVFLFLTCPEKILRFGESNYPPFFPRAFSYLFLLLLLYRDPLAFFFLLFFYPIPFSSSFSFYYKIRFIFRSSRSVLFFFALAQAYHSAPSSSAGSLKLFAYIKKKRGVNSKNCC